MVVEDDDDDSNKKEEVTKTDSTGEFSSSDILIKYLQDGISKFIETDIADSGAKGAKKSVSFEMCTCVQLDRKKLQKQQEMTVYV